MYTTLQMKSASTVNEMRSEKYYCHISEICDLNIRKPIVYLQYKLKSNKTDVIRLCYQF